MEQLFFIIIAVALAYGVGCMGRKRRIGFGWAFAIFSLMLFWDSLSFYVPKRKIVLISWT